MHVAWMAAWLLGRKVGDMVDVPTLEEAHPGWMQLGQLGLSFAWEQAVRIARNELGHSVILVIKHCLPHNIT